MEAVGCCCSQKEERRGEVEFFVFSERPESFLKQIKTSFDEKIKTRHSFFYLHAKKQARLALSLWPLPSLRRHRTMSSLTDVERAAKAERKAARKAAKKAAVAAAALASAEPAASLKDDDSKKKEKKRPAEEASDGATADDKAARKRLKKAAKKAAKEAAELKNGGDEEHGKEKSKSKKNKSELKPPSTPPSAGAPAVASASTSTPTSARPRPAVGDAKAAASGPPLVTDLYSEHAAVRATPDDAVAAWRAERGIKVTPPGGSGSSQSASSWKPCTEFAHAGFSATLLRSCADFVTPSPIQAQCWPLLLSGCDLVGIASTGSGKTLAFGLPLLAHAAANGAGRKSGSAAASHARAASPRGLVLAPTRELAVQIAGVLSDAGRPAGLGVALCYGGVPKGPQVAELQGRGGNLGPAAVVVGTPGRLQDLCGAADGGQSHHHHAPALLLSSTSFLVLDEADRMLDLGFEPHVRAIAAATRADRQTAMFSATWPSAVRSLAADFLAPGPARVVVGSADLAASHSVEQRVEVLEPRARDSRLDPVLRSLVGRPGSGERAIVFVLYKKEAPRVESLLARNGWKAGAVHGDAPQAARSAAVDAFRAGRTQVLVATDVAARGLDIPDVAAVINYSFPLTTEDYVHRIGRTGRAGKTGRAHTFFSGATDRARAGELVNVLREAGREVPADLLKFGTTVKKKESKLYGAHFHDIGEGAPKATKVTFDSDDE